MHHHPEVTPPSSTTTGTSSGIADVGVSGLPTGLQMHAIIVGFADPTDELAAAPAERGHLEELAVRGGVTQPPLG